MQYSRNLLLPLLAVVLLIAGCRKDSENPVDSGKHTVTVTTTIAGIVSDESGKGMSNALVTAHGKTATTNEHGLFIIKDVRVPEDRCFVLVNKTGYFTASRAEIPKVNNVTHMRLGLMSNKAEYTVQSAAGGTVSLKEGGSVQFPANAFVTEGGQSYTGVVKIAARWLNPTSESFFQFFPGDFAARRSDGSDAFLYSYGVLNVELFSQNGDKLQLASGKKAVLQYPIPGAMQADAPSEMPLWYFDETLGMWKEDGKAIKQGSIYAGEVSHFTPWNCDVPVPMAIVEGQVLCDVRPVADIIVKIGQSEVITDGEGRYRCAVRADRTFEISVDAEQNDGISAIPIAVGPLAQNQVLTQDIVVGPCPSYLVGTLVDCNEQPTEGLAEITMTNGYYYALVGSDGKINIRVKSEVAFNLVCHGFSAESGTSEPVSIEPVLHGDIRDLGQITACGDNAAISYTDLAPSLSAVLLAFSPDGEMVVGAGGGVLHIYSTGTQSESLIHEIQMREPLYTRFSQNSARLMTGSGTAEGDVQIWNTATWANEANILLPNFSPGGGLLLHPDGESVVYTRKEEEMGATVHSVNQYTIGTGAITELFRLPGSAPRYRMCEVVGFRNGGQQVVYVYMVTNTSEPFVEVHVAVWDRQTGVVSDNVIENKDERSPMLLLSANGNRLLMYYSDRMQIVDVDNGAKVLNLSEQGQLFGKPAEYEPIALSPDGSQFVASFADFAKKPFGIYSSQTGNLVKVLPVPVQGTASYVDVIRFSANGRKIGGRTLSAHRQRIWHLP